MYSLLLRKALPFALTFILGSLVGGLFKAVGIGGSASNGRAYFYRHRGRHGCDHGARTRYLVAESKSLQITFKPDASWPKGVMVRGGTPFSTRLNVTFGADGKVAEVTSLDSWLESTPSGRGVLTPVWLTAEGAARQIQFEPETVDGLPVTVTREVEIRFTDAD